MAKKSNNKMGLSNRQDESHFSNIKFQGIINNIISSHDNNVKQLRNTFSINKIPYKDLDTINKQIIHKTSMAILKDIPDILQYKNVYFNAVIKHPSETILFESNYPKFVLNKISSYFKLFRSELNSA